MRLAVGRDEIHVVTAGSGPALVLLHGWPVTSRHWSRVMPDLARSHRVVAVALPGLGLSTNADGDYTKKAMAGVILRTLDVLGVDRFALAGHDWGGSVAFALAAMERERVTSLVLEEELLPGFRVDPDGLASGTYPTWHVGFHRLPELPELLIRGHEAEYYGYFWDLTARAGAVDEDARAEYLEVYRQDHVLDAGLALYRVADRDAADNGAVVETPLTIPVLAVGGGRAIGGGVARSVRHAARSVQEHVIAGCGHYPAYERPAEWLDVVRPFLASNA